MRKGANGNTWFSDFARIRRTLGPFFDSHKGIEEIMGYFLLVVHWTMYFYTLLLLVYELKYGSYLNDLQQTEWMVAIIPFVVFTLIYWNIKNQWAFFPWQHVKPEE